MNHSPINTPRIPPHTFSPSADLLHNRIILVTGASDGIGKQAAISYARHGAYVILLGRDPDKLGAVARHISDHGGLARYYRLDYTHASEHDCQRLATQLRAWLSEQNREQPPRLDGLLHNAGTLGEVRPMIEQTPDRWRDVIHVNINTTFFLTQALLPLLLNAASPSLVFTTSSVGRQGRANWGAYAVSKFATEGMMQVLAQEYAQSPLRVNCINPGATRSKMRASAFPQENPDSLKTPADLMPLYLWIMSEASQGYSGNSFNAPPYLNPEIVKYPLTGQ